MTDDERELLRLQTLLALWPEPRSREEFKTELHLKRAVSDAFSSVFEKPTVYEMRDAARRVLRAMKDRT